MQEQTVFRLEDVSFSYTKPLPALSGISLEIAAGENCFLLGANGSGKSTLLKMLDGLIFPDAGAITAFGAPLTEKALKADPFPFRRRVGFVFQDPDAQLFCTNVYDEIAFGPLQLDWDEGRVRRAVDDALRDFDLLELRNRPPYRLSGGEKKKTALASVMAVAPEVLLLDEPANGLDPRTKRWLTEKLMELNRAGTTVVIATHDLDLAGQMAGRVVVLNEAHGLCKAGEPGEILGDRELLAAVNLI